MKLTVLISWETWLILTVALKARPSSRLKDPYYSLVISANKFRRVTTRGHESLSKAGQRRRERWPEQESASGRCRCPSGRPARSGTRCGRAAGSASGSWVRSRWQGSPPGYNDKRQAAKTKKWTKQWHDDVWRFRWTGTGPVLTARMKRLSVAAGKISFSRVNFLQKKKILTFGLCKNTRSSVLTISSNDHVTHFQKTHTHIHIFIYLCI